MNRRGFLLGALGAAAASCVPKSSESSPPDMAKVVENFDEQRPINSNHVALVDRVVGWDAGLGGSICMVVVRRDIVAGETVFFVESECMLAGEIEKVDIEVEVSI